jgi:hypothetical protein
MLLERRRKGQTSESAGTIDARGNVYLLGRRDFVDNVLGGGARIFRG